MKSMGERTDGALEGRCRSPGGRSVKAAALSVDTEPECTAASPFVRGDDVTLLM